MSGAAILRRCLRGELRAGERRLQPHRMGASSLPDCCRLMFFAAKAQRRFLPFCTWRLCAFAAKNPPHDPPAIKRATLARILIASP
jgi:hypothetical protein